MEAYITKQLLSKQSKKTFKFTAKEENLSHLKFLNFLEIGKPLKFISFFLHISRFEHFMQVFIYLCNEQIFVCKQSEYEYHNPLAKCEFYSNNINKNKL